jgi:hypothetical protein
VQALARVDYRALCPLAKLSLNESCEKCVLRAIVFIRLDVGATIAAQMPAAHPKARSGTMLTVMAIFNALSFTLLTNPAGGEIALCDRPPLLTCLTTLAPRTAPADPARGDVAPMPDNDRRAGDSVTPLDDDFRLRLGMLKVLLEDVGCRGGYGRLIPERKIQAPELTGAGEAD